MSTNVSLSGLRWARVAAAIALTALLALTQGCASRPHSNPSDPLEPFNRGVSQFNEGVDSLLLKPAATVYREVIPAKGRTGVSNFFGNLGDLWSFANAALQFKLQFAAENFMRFNVNTFFGLGGLLDVASELNIERHREDFGQTLGRWGVPAGPYIVLPFLGPSTLRDTLALSIDRKGDLVQQIDPLWDRSVVYAIRAVDIRANLLRASGVLDEAALDKYSFTRDAFLQKRRAEIYGQEDDDPDAGKEPPADSPAPADPATGQPATAPKR